MLTFQQSYQEIQSLTGDSSASATTKHKARWNFAYKKMLQKFNKRTESKFTTIAGTQEYELPYNLNKITSIKLTIDDIDYPLTEIVNEDKWNNVNSQGTSFTSDIQTNYYIKDEKLILYPTPATDDYTITIYHTLTDKDLSQDSYTTGTITTLPYTITFTTVPAASAVSGTLSSSWTLPTGVYQVVFDNGDVRNVTLTITKTTATWTTALTVVCTTVTVTVNNLIGGSILITSGATLTAGMVGRYIKTDDGYWYRIYSYLDSSTVTLDKKYGGTAISSGTSTFVINEIPQIPEDSQYAPIHYACWLYFMSKRDNTNASFHQREWEKSYEDIRPEEDKTTTMFVDNSDYEIRNPNDYPQI
jgi:hypothetical protein